MNCTKQSALEAISEVLFASLATSFKPLCGALEERLARRPDQSWLCLRHRVQCHVGAPCRTPSTTAQVQ